jgi:hypothetical protein
LKGTQFDNVTIKTDKPDARPAFVLDHVQGADFSRVNAGTPAFALHEVSGFSALHCNGVKDTELLGARDTTL